MSGFIDKTELIESLKEGAVITGVTVGGFMILKYFFKLTPSTPSKY